MMTLEQFKSNHQAYRKYEWISIVYFMGGILTMGGVGSLVARRVEAVGFDLVSILILLGAFLVVATMMSYGAIRYPNRRMRELGLLCPTCGKQLVGFSSQVVIATGKCGYCGCQVLGA